MHLHPLAPRRARAYGRDCLGYLAIAVATVPIGVVAVMNGWSDHPVFLGILSSVPPVLATLIAARAESGPSAATWGKRREGLRVTTGSGTPGIGRALARNTAKIAIPWSLGHLVAFSAASGRLDGGDAVAMGGTILVDVLLVVMVAMTVAGAGRPPHDRVAGTRVITA